MSVLDASTIVRGLLRLPGADEVKRYIFDTAERQAAPDLVNAEVLQAVRRSERLKIVDAAASTAAVEALAVLPIVRYATAPLVQRAWALRHNFTAYDAMYVALAEAVDMRLVTTDERLAAAARAHARIEVVLLAAA